jgi:hypothetical protein
MSDVLSGVIAFTLSNFTLTFLVVAAVVSVIVIAVRRPPAAEAAATALNWFLFFAIGVTYTFNAIIHTAFGDMSAAMIGWDQSPFQAEVGFASLGVGIVGFMAFARRASLGLKLAAIVGPACFLWGAAATHIADIITTGNVSPHNAGVILYTDIFIPIIGFALWTVVATQRKKAQRRMPMSTERTSAPTATATTL